MHVINTRMSNNAGIHIFTDAHFLIFGHFKCIKHTLGTGVYSGFLLKRIGHLLYRRVETIYVTLRQ
jgi:hypothetical protein